MSDIYEKGKFYCAAEKRDVEGWVSKFSYWKGYSCVKQMDPIGTPVPINSRLTVEVGTKWGNKIIWGYFGGELGWTYDSCAVRENGKVVGLKEGKDIFTCLPKSFKG